LLFYLIIDNVVLLILVRSLL